MAKRKKARKKTRKKSVKKTKRVAVKKEKPVQLNLGASKNFLPIVFFFIVAILLLLVSIYAHNAFNALVVTVAVLALALIAMAIVMGKLTNQAWKFASLTDQVAVKRPAKRRRKKRPSLKSHGPRQWG